MHAQVVLHTPLKLTLTTLWANSADDSLGIYFIFPRKQDLTLQKETICMKCFLGKIKNKIKMSSAENFTLSVKFKKI